jgi:hypothetical protein
LAWNPDDSPVWPLSFMSPALIVELQLRLSIVPHPAPVVWPAAELILKRT